MAILKDLIVQGPSRFIGEAKGTKFVTDGGTSSLFVKGDGTLDDTNYAPLASPALTGTPTAPTAAASTNSTQIATTAFVKTAVSGKQDTISDLATIRSGASAGATAYQKPSGGIPKTDLASAVLTSLGKADSALLSFTETDPTVPSWAKQSSKPTYTAQEVGALPSTTSIPSKTSDLTNDSGFITTSDISGVYKYKGTKTNYSNLPTSGNVTGDVWNVTNANGNIPAGTNYAWNGSAWDALGGSVDLSGYVPTSRTINGKPLSANITLSASDVSALPSSTTIPTALADLTADSTHRLVTDTEKSTWNGKQDPATTLAGYGITDAKIQNGVITLGSNTITPLTSHLSLSNYVTLNGAQSITGEKTFTGNKRIKFKLSTSSDKLGFTLYNSSNVEVGFFEWEASSINAKSALTLGLWVSTDTPVTPGYLGFKVVDVTTAARYALVTPLLADAKTPLSLNNTLKLFYFPLLFKNGTNTVTTANTGVVDLSTLMLAYELASNKVTSIDSSSTDTLYPSAKCVYDAINNINPRIPITNHGTSDTTFALTPNIYHKWGSVSSLTLTLATPDDVSVMNEYIFSFTSPATPTTLSVPASVNWVTSLDILANKEYRISIIDNLATWITSDMVVPIGDVNTPEFATKAYVDAGLALKEDSSNKVISVDENSTDTQYPSAKAMYDALNPS